MEETKEFDLYSPNLMNFSPIVLVRDVLKNWFLILVVTVVAGIASYIVCDQSYEPVYQTNTTLVVTTQSSSTTVYSNLQSTTELASVFTELLNSSLLQKTILEELEMAHFDGTITASAIAETNLLTIQVTASNPRTAFLVMQALIENHQIVTYEVVGNIVLEVLQLPRVPVTPCNTPNIKKQVMMIMIMAAIAACAGLVLLSYFRDTVRSRTEADQKLNCWCLGEIDHEQKYKTLLDRLKRRRKGLLITNPANSFHFVETIRKLRRRVEQHMGNSKVLMVTSVMENEGKSTVAVNLALALAKKHSRVLLIDLDLRKPACHKILEFQENPYNTHEVLSGDVSISQAVVKETLSGLNLLLERKYDSKTVDLVTTEGLASMLDAARREYDYVVLDLAPMSAAPDTEYIMEYADATLLVVQQNLVRTPALNRAITILQGGKAKLLGCVLNNVYTIDLSALTRTGYGKYGYGYGYGKYGYGKYGYGRYGYGAYGAYGAYEKHRKDSTRKSGESAD